MNTRDHKKLAAYIIKQSCGFKNKISEIAFKLGSVEPDYNYATYFKGSIKHKFLMGHNYSNSLKFVEKTAKKLESKPLAKWNSLDYYRLGKLVHYIADDFTAPHNEDYQGAIIKHCFYEMEISRLLCDYLKDRYPEKLCISDNAGIFDIIKNEHSNYLRTYRKPSVDIDWIVRMCWLTVSYYIKPKQTADNSTIHYVEAA